MCKLKWASALCIMLFFLGYEDALAWDQHGVGWFAAVVPGGGNFALGEYWSAVRDATVVGTTFGVGYTLATRDSFTLDGAPLDYPAAASSVLGAPTRICTSSASGTPVCRNSYGGRGRDGVDVTKENVAAVLQEFGIKYHMVSVFDAYRRSYLRNNGDSGQGQGIDARPISDIFMDPFDSETLKSPWVWIPIALSAGVVAYDYHDQIHAGVPRGRRLNTFSNAFMGFNQMMMYPTGSGAPEEMFYRGFIQNEAYGLWGTPYFSVLMSSLAFAYSHLPEERLDAFGAGLYFGYLAHKNQGRLNESVAVHFWSVVIIGAESFLLSLRSQARSGKRAPVGTQVSFMF